MLPVAGPAWARRSEKRTSAGCATRHISASWGSAAATATGRRTRATRSGALGRLVEAAARQAADDVPTSPGRHLRWTDSSGASLALHLDGQAIECVTPCFVSPEPTRWRVRTAAALTNGLSGLPFRHARIATLPGAIDVLFDEAEGVPARGKLAVVRGWLVGQPDAVPPPVVAAASRGFFRKLLGR